MSTIATDPTAATEAALDIESIKQILDGFDPASLLPDLTSIFGIVTTACRIAVLIGPVILLVLGIAYLFFSPKEANYHFGYRCFYGMGSVEAWRFCQKLAGIVWAALGLVLTVVMLLLSGGLSAMPIMDAIGFGLRCILWEIGIAAVSILGINLTLAIRYDRRGDRRGSLPQKEEDEEEPQEEEQAEE